MKKRLSLLLLFFLFSLGLFASSSGLYLGVEGGYALNALLTTIGYREDVYYIPYHGFEASIPIRYQFNETWGLESGITYLMKSYLWLHMVSDYTYFDYLIYNNHYLEVPIAATFKFGSDNVKSVTSLGGYFGYHLLSKRRGTLASSSPDLADSSTYLTRVSDTLTFNKVRDNRFDAGILFKTGIEVELSKVLLFIRSSLYLSLTDMNKRYQYDEESRYNLTLTITAGALFSLGGKE